MTTVTGAELWVHPATSKWAIQAPPAAYDSLANLYSNNVGGDLHPSFCWLSSSKLSVFYTMDRIYSRLLFCMNIIFCPFWSNESILVKLQTSWEIIYSLRKCIYLLTLFIFGKRKAGRKAGRLKFQYAMISYNDWFSLLVGEVICCSLKLTQKIKIEETFLKQVWRITYISSSGRASWRHLKYLKLCLLRWQDLILGVTGCVAGTSR